MQETISYQQSLNQLQTAIIERKPEAALALLGRKTPSLARRLNAYIDGYRIRLRQVVSNDYPATLQAMGAEAFHAHVADYVECTTSASYTIDAYSLGFADFLKAQQADHSVADIATIELAISEVFWQPDSNAFVPAADFSMEALEHMTIKLRKASRLLALSSDAEAYVAAFRAEQPAMLSAAEPTPHYLMVVRHQHQVRRHVLESAEYHTLQALSGQPFGAALEQLMAQKPELAAAIGQQLGTWLTRWIHEGFWQTI